MSNDWLAYQNPSSTDERLDTESLTIGGFNVHRERIQVTGATEAQIAAVQNSAPTTEYGVVTRNIPSGTQTVSGTVTANAGTGPFPISDNGGSITVDGSVSLSGSIDTELPAATALADNTANPTVPGVGAFNMVFDGSTWDRAPGTSTDGTLVNLGANNDVTVTGTVTANLAAGTNNIGDVDVLTVPAPLSTTGGGTEATALRVTIANDSTGLVSVDDNGGSLTVDNGGTFAVQATLQTGDNTVGRVKLTDGTDVADVLDLTNSNPLTVAIVDGSGTQITSFGGGTQYAEDTAHVSGDTMTMAGVVQQSADAALSTDGDRSLLQVDSSGYLKVNVKAGSAGATEYVEDAAAAANPQGGAVIMVRADTPATVVTTDGDNVALRSTNYGAAYVQVVSSAGAFVDTFGGGTQYTEGDTDASITGTAMMMEGAANTLVPAQGTAADGLLVNLGANNDVTVTSGSVVVTSGSVTADTELATPATLADNTVNPSVTSCGAFNHWFDGSTWDRARGDSTDGLLVNLGANNDISGTVTANAGTNLNTSALALETTQTSVKTAVELIDDTVATLGTTTYTEATTKGLTIGAVRRDADTTLVGTTNEIGPLQMDANGRLKVEAFSGETLPVSLTSTTITGTVAVTQSGTWDEVGINDSGNSITVDAPIGTPVNVQIGDGTRTATVRDTGASDSLNVAIVDASGNHVTSFGGGTQYTEDAAAAADPVGTAMIMVRDDALSGQTTTDGDNIAARGTDKGELYVKHVDAIPITDNSGSLTVDGTVAISGAVDTELVAAAALADNTANPTVTSVGTFLHCFDGTTWDRTRGDSTDGMLVNLGTNNDVTVTGSVTANAGTNLNTSALNLEATQTSVLTSLQIIDDWDESDRAKVNLIVGQAGVQGGAGAVSATTQRVAIATDANAVTCSGPAADDASSGSVSNPIMVGGQAVSPDGTDPGNVSDEDDVAICTTDLNRRLYTNTRHARWWSYHSDGSTALTDASVQAAPGAGFEIVITEIMCSTGAATAMNIFFEEGSTKIMGPWYLEAVAGRGVYWSGEKHVTANTAVTVTTSAAIAQSVDVQGYIQKV